MSSPVHQVEGSPEPSAGKPEHTPEEKTEAQKPVRLGIDWKILPFVGFGLLMMIAPAICQEMGEGPILRNGTPAKARVLAIKPTGGSYNDDQEVEIDVEVLPPGEEAYRAQVETFIHPVHFPQYQPGAMVDVRFDPKKRKNVVLVRP
jgi:hypothetical protein